MSVLVTERWSPPKLAYTSGGYRAQRVFDVTGVATQDSAIGAVVAHDATTAYNAKHPLSQWMYVDGQSCDMGGFTVAVVTISYASNPAGRHVDPGNPLTEPARYHFTWGTISTNADTDASGNPAMNTAGEPFSEPLPAEIVNGFLTVERNEPFYDATTAVDYQNAVNIAPVSFNNGAYGLLKGQACLRNSTAVTPITSAATFATIRYVIELRGGKTLDSDGFWDGFKVRALNQGRRAYWDDAGTKRIGNIMTLSQGTYTEVSSDVRLDPVGRPIRDEYKVAARSGVAAAVASPIALPTSAVLEATRDGNGNIVAYFCKYFPRGIQIRDLNTLGL
jgi:hypothetical protein